MRSWMIVLASLVAAVAAGAAMVRPELASMPHAAVLPHLLSVPGTVVAALAVYALCAIVLTAGGLIFEMLGLRRRLVRSQSRHDMARPAWTAAFENSRLRRLVPAPAAGEPASAADSRVVLQSRFRAEEARREIARLYYIEAARAHFLSALVILAAAAVLGAAQQSGPLPSLPWPIPAIPAGLAVGGLVLLAALARVAVDVAAEPLIETIARQSAETPEAALLRRAAALFETARAGDAPALPGAAGAQLSESLAVVLDQSHRALADAVERLSATTNGLAATTTSSIEALEAAFRAGERHPAPETAMANAAIGELREAVSGLSAILGRVRAAPVVGDAAAEPARGEREPALAQELRKLLQEIETAP